MNAQDHYREAERLLRLPSPLIDDYYVNESELAHIVARAQVHATLSLAAATGCVGSESERRAWLDVTDDAAARAVSS